MLSVESDQLGHPGQLGQLELGREYRLYKRLFGQYEVDHRWVYRDLLQDRNNAVYSYKDCHSTSHSDCEQQQGENHMLNGKLRLDGDRRFENIEYTRYHLCKYHNQEDNLKEINVDNNKKNVLSHVFDA